MLGDRSPCKRTVGSNPTPSAPVVTVSGVPIGWLRGNIDELRRGRAIERRRAQEERRFRQAVADGRAVRGVQRDVYAHFRSAAPELNDFDEVREGLFTRPLHPEIRAVLKVAALTGASYTLCWGVSLAFVPHVTSTGTSLHRTAKSSRLDLWVDAHIELDEDRSGVGPDGRVAHRSCGDGSVWWVPQDFEALWSACRELAYAWWERVTTPSGVLEVAREQLEDRWAMSVHYPSPLYVAAFTTARLGDAEGARRLLERELQKWYVHMPDGSQHPHDPQRLRDALERIASTGADHDGV